MAYIYFMDYFRGRTRRRHRALSTEGMEGIWDLEGFCVLDDSGEVLADGEIDALMPGAFSSVNQDEITQGEPNHVGDGNNEDIGIPPAG